MGGRDKKPGSEKMDKKRILMIDDEENFCEVIKKRLERSGEFQVAVATNAKDGIGLAKKIRPDLILLDLIMPNTVGGDVAYEIKNDESIKNTPIIF